jgi:transketolase
MPNEVREAYKVIMALTDRPACLVLSRQKLPTFDRSRYAAADGLARGAYVMAGDLADNPAGSSNRRPDVILMASGSEVQLCISAYERLKQEGIAGRVVSMPSWELFEAQDRHYREEVLPPSVKARVTVEAGAVIGWDRYAGPDGTIIGMHRFGGSAPGTALMRKFGFVADTILQAARDQIAKHQRIESAGKHPQ